MKNIILSFIVLLTALYITSCKKDVPELNTTETSTDDPVVVNEDYTIIDSTDQQLVSTQGQLDNGTYVFNVGGGIIADVDDLIVGTEGAGFLRRVTSVTNNGSQVIYETVFADMNELFPEGDVNFSVNLNDSYQYKSIVEHSISNLELFNSNGVSAIANGSIGLDIPEINSELSFTLSGVDRLLFETVGAEFSGNLTIDIIANGTLPFIDIEDTIAGFKKKFIYPGPFGIPIVGMMTTDFIIKCTAEISANASTSITFENNSPINFGITFENGSWVSNIDFTSNTDVSYDPISGEIESHYHAELVPVIDIEFYGVVGPYGYVSLHNTVDAAVSSPSLDWDFSTSVWMETTIGAHASIFGSSLFDYTNSWVSPSIDYRTPYSIQYISGNSQIGQVGSPLSQPFKVRVLDDNGAPQSNVPVYFEVVSGNGSMSTTSVLSNASGYAQSTLTPGSGAQVVNVKAKKGDLSLLQSAPIIFNCNGNFNVQGRLDSGELPFDIYLTGVPYDSIMDKSYAGGLIYYLNISNGTGLVRQSGYGNHKWAPNSSFLTIVTGASDTQIGSGASNTLTIHNTFQPNGCAASQCYNDSNNGYTDWFLPSKDELQEFVNVFNSSWTGTSPNWYFWSSSEVSADKAWCYDLFNQVWEEKTKTNFVDHMIVYTRSF